MGQTKPFAARNRESIAREIADHVSRLYSDGIANQRRQHALPPEQREFTYSPISSLTAYILGTDLDTLDPELPDALAAAEAAEKEYQDANPHPRARRGEEGYEAFRAYRANPDRPIARWRAGEVARRFARLQFDDADQHA